MISFLDLAAVDALAQEMRIDPQQLRRARIAYLKKARDSGSAIHCLPAAARQAFADAVRFDSLSESRCFDSSIDGASKLVSRTKAGFAIETVILRTATGRTALCVSSQIGCAAACAFCATGHMGIARDLTSDEILDQLLLANRHLRPEGRRVRNLVFMGMGEPLHNESNVHAALSTLLNPVAFDHPASRILLSTVGVPDPWIRTAETFPTINYALSLHSAIGEQRAKIIPLAKRYSLEQIRDAIGELNRLQPAKTAVMVEYLMLDRFNDSMEDALALIDWLDGLRVHVNLIPFNPIAQAPDLRSSPREVIKRFAERIKANGFPTTIRYSLGKDIDAACGQLVIDENQALARELSAASRS